MHEEYYKWIREMNIKYEKLNEENEKYNERMKQKEAERWYSLLN
ncbi:MULTISPECIES: hypothetical protein [unclassified Colwellia]|jgi:hypothetical protein|nr:MULTISPECIES: hypothetical protein [unclassified Colwellia]